MKQEVFRTINNLAPILAYLQVPWYKRAPVSAYLQKQAWGQDVQLESRNLLPCMTKGVMHNFSHSEDDTRKLSHPCTGNATEVTISWKMELLFCDTVKLFLAKNETKPKLSVFTVKQSNMEGFRLPRETSTSSLLCIKMQSQQQKAR